LTDNAQQVSYILCQPKNQNMPFWHTVLQQFKTFLTCLQKSPDLPEIFLFSFRNPQEVLLQFWAILKW
jgi:hypothetical protein